MTPYLQGWYTALVKLGLSSSALGASKGVTTSTPIVKVPGVKGPAKPGNTNAWSGANKIEPKMHETAWTGAQKDLDTAEARVTAKVDQWQQPKPLPVGSA